MMYEKIVTEATDDVIQTLLRRAPHGVYLYWTGPPDDDTPGRIFAVPDGENKPFEAELVSPEKIRLVWDRAQLRRRIWELGRSLPLLPRCRP